MCCKYTIPQKIADMCTKDKDKICDNVTYDVSKKECGINTIINPDDAAPALIMKNNKASAVLMRWGFQSKEKKLIINARGESIRERKMFMHLADKQRCALPAAGYFEWRNRDKLRYLISRQDDQTFYLAGLYQYDAHGVPRFVVLTRSAYDEHAKLHDRMPCLLFSREEARRWISGKLSFDAFFGRSTDILKIEAQEAEQLLMEFDD